MIPKVVPQHSTAAGMKATAAQGQLPAPGVTGQAHPLEDIREFAPSTPSRPATNSEEPPNDSVATSRSCA